MRRQTIGILAAVPVLLVGLGACGSSNDGSSDGIASVSGSGSSPSASASGAPTSDEDRALKFAQCMREHGVDMPDPDTSGGRSEITIRGGPGDKAKIDKAMQACRQYMPNGGKGPARLSKEDQERALKFAQCMRQHGVDMPDPDFTGGGILQKGPRNALGKDDPKVKEAEKACQGFLPEARTKSGGGAAGAQ